MDNKIRSIIINNNVDALLVTNKYDITYVSKFTGEDSYVLLTWHNFYIFIDRRYMEQAKMQCTDFSVIVYDNKSDLMNKIEKLLNLNCVSKLGLDICDVKHAFYLEIKELLVNVEISNLREPFKEGRSIKTPEEIFKIKKASEIADKVFYRLLQIITEGMSEKDIEIELNYIIKREGGDGYAFDPIIGTEEKTSMPYSLPDKKVFVKKGDFILLNFGINYEGYTSAIARMVALGNIKDEYKKIYKNLYDVYMKILNSMKPYMEYKNLYNIFEKEISNSEYKNYFLKSIGHGRGLQTIEGYGIKPYIDRAILPNEVYSMGVSISIPELGGARLEDVVLIKDNTIEVLTNSVRNLLII